VTQQLEVGRQHTKVMRLRNQCCFDEMVYVNLEIATFISMNAEFHNAVAKTGEARRLIVGSECVIGKYHEGRKIEKTLVEIPTLGKDTQVQTLELRR